MTRRGKMMWIIVAVAIVCIGILLSLKPVKEYLLYSLVDLGNRSSKVENQRKRQKLNEQTKAIEVEWTDELAGDFSFCTQWVYCETVMEYISQKDSTETIYLNGPNSFHQKWEKKEQQMLDEGQPIVHFPYSLLINDFFPSHMEVEQVGKNEVECQSNCFQFEAPESVCLNLLISKNTCYPIAANNFERQFLDPWGDGRYIPSDFERIYACIEGSIQVDRKEWEAGWLKASFRFTFSSKSIHGKAAEGAFTVTGKIYSPIHGAKVERPRVYKEEQYRYRISLSSKYEV